jgi:archaeal flagellin FlaB
MTAPSYLKKDERAEVGIGTMIVFIATILVAAVAAGVLINTSQKLQDKSTRTGDDATANVGTSLTVLDVVGHRSDDGADALAATISRLDIFVTLAPGAEPTDLDALTIHYNDGTAVDVFSAGTAGDVREFQAAWIRGTGTDGVMQPGDLVRLQLGVTVSVDPIVEDDSAVGLGTSTEVDINLLPAQGNGISVGFTTPPTFSGDQLVTLF